MTRSTAPVGAGGRSRPAAVGPDLPVAEEKTRAVRAMFDTIAPRYDVVNRLMTFGLDVGWRRRTVAALGLPAGSLVVDVACGTGDLCRALARRQLTPVGVDLSYGMLRAGHHRAPVVHADASRLPLPDGAADGATCGFGLRNFTDLPGTLAELGRVVRPGGRIALLDVAPATGLLRLGHRLWFEHAVPRIGGALSDPAAYRYLPRSVAYLPPVPELLAMVRDAGFSGVNHRLMGGGIVQLVTATRRGQPPSDGLSPQHRRPAGRLPATAHGSTSPGRP